MNRRPGREGQLFLAALPFALVILAYLAASGAARAQPDDKLLPWPSASVEAMRAMALEPDKRSGDYLFWLDTAASLLRLVAGLAIAAVIGLVLGIAIGWSPMSGRRWRRSWPWSAWCRRSRSCRSCSSRWAGRGGQGHPDRAGGCPYLARDLLPVAELPEELLIKAQTMGASTWQMALQVVLPQFLPRLFSGLRLSLGPLGCS